ncbi:MAG: response regulator, partial [Myxococcales bacterium]
MDEQPSILLVDDDEVFRERLARALRERGWEVRTAGDYASAMEAARAESPQHALVDLRMPGRSGLELVRDLKACDATTKVVVLTGYGSIATA